MDKTIKSQWVAALRSGKYQQGREELRPTENTFCCLGVLCDVVAPECWEPGYDEEPTDIVDYTYAGCESEPPAELLRAVGFMERVDRVLGHEFEHVSHLVHMNDTDRAPFAEIADYIEREL